MGAGWKGGLNEGRVVYESKLTRAERLGELTQATLFTPKSFTTFSLSVRYWSFFKQTAKETILASLSGFITCTGAPIF